MRKTSSRIVCDVVPRRGARVALVLALAWSTPALAGPQGGTAADTGRPTMDAATAESKFNAGLRLFKAGKMADALPVFREVADGNGSPNARLYVGHCLQQLGKYVEAHKAFTAVVKQTTQRGDTKYEPTREAALAQLGLLEPRVAKIVVSLADIPSGLAVKLDGTPLEEKDLGSPIVVEPGAHKIEGSATDMAPVSRDLNVEAGESKTTILAFKKAEPSPAPVTAGPVAPKPEASPSKSNPLRTTAFVAGGVGVAGLTVFTISGLMAKSTFNRMSDQCGTTGCSAPADLEEIDKGKSQQTIANVGLVVGLVGLSAGAVLFLVSGKKNPDAPAVAITGLPGGGALSYSGKF